MDETPMLKKLVTKPSSELIHLALKGFSRTLLIAGLSNGCIAVLKWNTGEIDFSMDVCIYKNYNRLTTQNNRENLSKNIIVEFEFPSISL
jgi:hypothetical protein